jgi:polar amino acid transport system substrate-binding protein
MGTHGTMIGKAPALQCKHWFTVVLLCIVVLVPGMVAAQTVPLRIGAEDDWAPFSSVKDGKPVGMAVDLVQAIFAEAGIPIELVAVPYARCMEETKAGRLAGCFDTLQDANLRKDFRFHDKALFSDAILILARTENPISATNLKGLAGQKVIITHGYTYGDAFEADPAVRRVKASHDINALRMLDAKRGDYALIYERITNQLLRGEAQALRLKIKPVGVLTRADLYIAFSRKFQGMDGVLQRFNAAHLRLLKNQSLARIEERWN